MEKILEAANNLGHLLRKNEIVKRYGEIAEKLENDEEAKKLLDEYAAFTAEFREKEEAGGTIEVDEKKKLTEFNDRIKENAIISEFIATQAYYMNILQQVNEAIANPKGEPPRESTIITPDDNKGIIL
jgi:cell fate (sporulation/competence/biofilm development) regulator YlbF (YheA/YmcA/DUF963 family)